MSDFFEEVIKNGYLYVDKTLLIKDIIDSGSEVLVFSRPTAFGKTFNLTMLRSFFDINLDSKELFKGLKIMDAGDKYTSKMNKYPVIYLKLSNVNYFNIDDTMLRVKYHIMDAIERFRYLLDSDKLMEFDKKRLKRYLNGDITEVELTEVIKDMCYFLYKHHGERAIVLLDEYDSPIRDNYNKEFYKKILNLWYNLLGTTFKGNEYLERGIMFGIDKIITADMWGGANNVIHYGVTNNMFAEYFGYTEEEVDNILKEKNLLEKKEEITKWYGGFKIGNISNMYNPCTLMHYLKGCFFECYWMTWHPLRLFKKYAEDSVRLKVELLRLLTGEVIEVYADEYIDYNSGRPNPWTKLIITGFLSVEEEDYNNGRYKVRITNYEAKYKIIDYMDDIKYYSSQIDKIARSITEYNCDDLGYRFNYLVEETFDKFPNGYEQERDFFYTFILKLYIRLFREYNVSIFDNTDMDAVVFEPNDKSKPCFVMCFKLVKNNFEEEMDNIKNQVKTQEYDTSLKQKGYTNIRRLVFAFQGKKFEIVEF